MRAWWGRLSLRARLAGAFGLLAAGALIFVLAIIARTLGLTSLEHGKILPAAIFALAAFFVGGWFVAGWCLVEISRIGERINERQFRPLPTELEGLAALLRREAQKRDQLLNELRRFTADASHELRTPLTAIRTVGEVALRKGQSDPARLTEAIASMLEEAQRMNALVERLLRLARVESESLIIKPRDLELERHLIGWCDSVGVLAEEKGLQLRAECQHDLRITTDPELLGDAVANLLLNAIQHAPPGSTVSLIARESANSTIAIDVRDQGPGIPSEHRERIFERFYRVDSSRARSEGGFGLGLCTAKTSVERLGGTIGLRTIQGNGTTFIVTLPKRFIRQG